MTALTVAAIATGTTTMALLAPATPATATAGSSIVTLVPARFLETRSGAGDATFDGEGLGGGRVAAGGVVEVRVAGRGGVHADAEAAMLNVTAVAPSASGFLTVFPCGAARPGTSNVNYLANDVSPNAVLAKIGDGGKVCIFSLAETDVIVDVNGYVPAGAATPPTKPPTTNPPSTNPPPTNPPWEVEPGIWLGPPAGRYVMDDALADCFWERFNLLGSTWHQLTSGLQDIDGRAGVDLQGWEDFAFSVECGRPKLLATVGNPLPTAGPGAHVVGHHVQPGTYELEITEDMLHCRWYRVSEFAGIDAPLDVGVFIEPEIATVEILPSDAGFITNCGTWTRIA